MDRLIDGVTLTPLRIVQHPDGDILHGLRTDSPGYAGFGEAYFSTVSQGRVKGWKRHRRMTLNLIVPVGEVRFVVHDDRPDSPTRGRTAPVVLSPGDYRRLTVAPMLWVAFQGVGDGLNLVLNVANLPHDPAEADREPLDHIAFDWRTT
jgi:dTDP-4-dehydrorhamnose 3,5-epimerase